MKNKRFWIIFGVLLLIVFIISAIYFYMYLNKRTTPTQENETNIYTPPVKTNLIGNVDVFLFTKTDQKLFYEGGPVHWGSRTVTFSDVKQTADSKIVNLHVVDESDMKGESPKKEWNQKWEVNSDGSLYVDDVLMLKSPIVAGQEWTITNYSPVVTSDKKYNATVKIVSVENRLTDTNAPDTRVYTNLVIDDLKTVDGGPYTETRVFQSGMGLRELDATEPTISQLTLKYWFSSSNPIK